MHARVSPDRLRNHKTNHEVEEGGRNGWWQRRLYLFSQDREHLFEAVVLCHVIPLLLLGIHRKDSLRLQEVVEDIQRLTRTSDDALAIHVLLVVGWTTRDLVRELTPGPSCLCDSNAPLTVRVCHVYVVIFRKFGNLLAGLAQKLALPIAILRCHGPLKANEVAAKVAIRLGALQALRSFAFSDSTAALVTPWPL